MRNSTVGKRFYSQFQPRRPYSKDNRDKQEGQPQKKSFLFKKQKEQPQQIPQEKYVKTQQNKFETKKVLHEELAQGEYIEEEVESSFHQNVNQSTNKHQPQSKDNQLTIEEILEGNILKEVKLEDEASKMNKQFQQFKSKYGISSQTQFDISPHSSQSDSPDDPFIKSSIKSTIEQSSSKLQEQFKVPKSRNERKNQNYQSFEQQKLQFTVKLSNRLKEVYGDNHPILKQITEEFLIANPHYINIINEYQYLLYRTMPEKASFTKTYTSKEQKDLDEYQSMRQSEPYRIVDQFVEVSNKSIPIMREAKKGQEGIDFRVEDPDNEDPNYPSEKRLIKQIKRRINELKLKDPAGAEEAKQFLQTKYQLDKVHRELETFDFSQVKRYPGNEKGPNPEDDPDHYTKWFIENQPPELKQDDGDLSYLGIKPRFMMKSKDQVEKMELHSQIDQFLHVDEEIPMTSYQGQPEFAIFNRDNYNVENDEDVPSLAFHTPMAPDELPPVPHEHSWNYQEEFNYELERWTVFRSLPMIMKFDRTLVDFYKGIKNGTIKCPDYVNEINPKSMWQYYYTLPKWARDHPAVRQVLMAYEYNQPAVSGKNKDLVLNFAASLIRPIDDTLREVITDIATSNKIRMNVELGKQMVSELKFYELDPLTLGDLSDVEEEEEYGPMLDGIEDEDGGKISKGIDDFDEERKEQISLMQRIAEGLDEDQRDQDKQVILGEEQSIGDYSVQPELEKVLTDFEIKPYPTIDFVKEDNLPTIPIDFYDNDDGFWDDYIKMKRQKWSEHDMIVNRIFFKH